MHKKILTKILIVFGLIIAITATVQHLVNAAPPDNSPVVLRIDQTDVDGNRLFRLEIEDVGSNVETRLYDSSLTLIDQHTATAAETASYREFEERTNKIRARQRLNRVVATLRGWSNDAETTVAQWDSLTQSEKDQRLQTTIDRLGKFFDRMADVIVAQGLDAE